jgi:hypothetical protein
VTERNGFKTLDYASLGVAIGISSSMKILEYENKIQSLEDRLNKLENINKG